MSSNNRQAYALKSAVDLPDCMSVGIMASYMGISRGKAYDVANMDGFPRLVIGKRIVIPKDRFLQWIDDNTTTNTHNPRN